MESLSKPKRINCFICGNVKENEGENFTIFNVPKGKVEEWRVAIGNDQLKQTSRLCDVHFTEEDVIKGKLIGGVFYNAKVLRLQKGAVPKLFLSKRSFVIRHRARTSKNKQQSNSTRISMAKNGNDLSKLKTCKKPKEKHLSRTSCWNCNSPVSNTSIRMWKTNHVSCRNCYPLVKKLEESEKRLELQKTKNQKLKNQLKNATRTLDCKNKKIEEQRLQIEKCEQKILELKKQTDT